MICEDAWSVPGGGERPLHENDLATQLIHSDFLVNLSASPFYRGKISLRDNVVGSFARRANAPLFWVNQVGAHDDLLFDGSSTIFDRKGQVLYRMPAFEEGLGIIDVSLDRNGDQILHAQMIQPGRDIVNQTGHNLIADVSEVELIRRGLVLGIRDYFRKTGFTKAVLGLSGGIDSAVVACLLSEALGPKNIVGILMPSKYNSAGSITDALELARNLGIHTYTAPIQDPVDAVLGTLDPLFNQLRDDGINTSNKSELAVGQCTTYGDMAGALGPIGDLFKMEVYELADLYPQIPQAIRTKAPSAELAPGQTDEAKFGPFAILDQVLRRYLEEGSTVEEIVAAGFERDYVLRTLSYVRAHEFKRRQSTIILKVSRKAFGPGRRIPIAAQTSLGRKKGNFR